MNLIIIIILTALLQVFAPWWVVAIVPFVVFLVRPATAKGALGTGFASIAILWLAYGFYLHFNSDGAMSDRVAGIFSLPSGILLLFVSSVVGGITGSLSGLSGNLVRRLWSNVTTKSLSH